MITQKQDTRHNPPLPLLEIGRQRYMRQDQERSPHVSLFALLYLRPYSGQTSFLSNG